MKLWKLLFILTFLISGCTAVNENQLFTNADVSSVVLAKKYSRDTGPQEITNQFSMEGVIHAVFALRSKKIIKGRNNYHETSIAYYKGSELIEERAHKFNMKENIWYVIMDIFPIGLGSGDFIGKFYVDGNLVDTKQFTISSKN